MGYPMAGNLLRAGHEVALWSHTAEKARRLAAEEKGRFCETPREAARLFRCMGPQRDFVAGAEEVARHGVAHQAQSEKAKFCHRDGLYR